jgi:hypothetical protein
MDLENVAIRVLAALFRINEKVVYQLAVGVQTSGFKSGFLAI